jgi:hypothetical protein
LSAEQDVLARVTRLPADLAGTPVSLASAEDAILSKLEWAKKGGSERQIADAAGIVAVKGTSLDRDYLERWARELGVIDLWQEIASPPPRES